MYTRLGLVIALIIFASDLATKWFVAEVVMNPPRVIEVFPFFNLVLGFNRGISFGLLNSDSPAAPYLLSAFALVVVGLLVVWLRRSKHAAEAAGIGAIIGGAAANIADRLADGAVTDFLDFYIGSYHWPAFNVADAAIFCGVVLLIVPPWLYGSNRSQKRGKI
ncbi:signal peptidase II [Pyruvatibacter mobilis]|uniref:signal peptidase II n=1 Tax=Pyruvatibacter mobilis TaxID=1712261 RepID=UPI003BA92A6F